MSQSFYRIPLDEEMQILLKLLEINITDLDILKEQLNGILVEKIDDNGSLLLKIPSNARLTLLRGLIVEARCPDIKSIKIDDPYINLLLHVSNGKLAYLEIYKDDGNSIFRKPNPNNFELFSRLVLTCGD